MLDLKIVDYWQGALDYLHKLDYLSNDVALWPEELHSQYPNIRVCVKPNIIGADEIVGFYLTQPNAKVYRIAKFCVASRYRRQYVGTLMMDHLLTEAWEATAVTAVVDEYNIPGQCFLRSFGYRFSRYVERGRSSQDMLFVKEFDTP